MNTGLVSSTSSSATTSTSKTATKELDKNAFLKLLVAQLQNQDPTAPQDTNQMVQQMTSYSSLEQLQNMNTALEAIQVQNTGLFQAQSANLVGKKVRVSSSGLNLKDGSASMTVNLASEANVSIAIKDSSGKVVRTLDEGSLKAGDHSVDWNGLDAQGNKLADGSYTVEITAKDSAGKAVTATPSSYVTVSGVVFSNGAVLIQAGGKTYSLSDVTEVSA